MSPYPNDLLYTFHMIQENKLCTGKGKSFGFIQKMIESGEKELGAIQLLI